VTILEAIADANLFEPFFRPMALWRSWLVFLAATFGVPLAALESLFGIRPADALALYQAHTQRQTWPGSSAREGWIVVGARGGKSRIVALTATFLACFRDYSALLAPGERGILMVIAADRDQARVVYGYILAFIRGVPMLNAMLEGEPTLEAINLANRVTIKIQTGNYRSVRDWTVIGCIASEIAVWRSDDSANPDVEVLRGVRRGMLTIPGAMLFAISSPYARRGALWETYRRHFGKENPRVLVWQAPTWAMNLALSEDHEEIRAAYEEDEVAAAAEYGAEFRRDVESFVSREAVDAVTVPGRLELAPVPDRPYVAFVDPSGGSSDSMTLAIAHAEERDGASIGVLDCVRERKPPFSPDDVVQEFAATLKDYSATTVVGDRYAGEWPRERFRAHGIEYVVAEKPKSDLYRELLPLLNSERVELLELPRLIAQLCSLERRTARGGRDSIDSPPKAHEDVANSVAGACVLAAASIGNYDIDTLIA
jgi:hypothetical protein